MTLLLVLLLGVALFFLVRWTRSGRPPPLSRHEEAQWEERVLRLTRDNRGAMERAVMARRRKFPRATRLELLTMVHDEYVRDRE